MNILLSYIFIFYIGCTFGWCLEVVYRRFTKSNTSRKWINPGFLVGPYLPLYGFGLCILFSLSRIGDEFFASGILIKNIIVVVLMAVCMTLLELITGLVCIKRINVRLWDYSDEWKNYKGIICPKFSAIWGILGGIYYFLIDEYILSLVSWSSGDLLLTFALGLFVGVFIIDLGYGVLS